MKDHYVTYEQAVKLKELGFDWKCYQYYIRFADDGEIRRWHASEPDNNNARLSRNEVSSAPRLDQAQAWLREVKGIAINVIAHDGGQYHWCEVYLPNFKEDGYRWWEYREHPLMDSFEEALSAGIDKALELLTDAE